ncbi:jacalin-related lectin 3-like [Rosa rugosa]|uniref:jacalin-related lectin 3-like n=1 Tax=Rosa rugosa TaxID=74645 RepID=UPI002B407762|nr:jacalin-related lectin 3-like [Rosa rugosa]
MNPEKSKKTVVSVGPFGSLTERGNPFDDGIHSAVKGLAIAYLEGEIISNIRFEYDDDGISVWSDKHGEGKTVMELFSGLMFRKESIIFNYPDEFLTAVHGRYTEDLFGSGAVTSLTFKTNRNTYGPFGWTSQNHKLVKHSSCFSIHVPGNKIVGFHGRSKSKWSGGIYSIGAYVKPYHQQIDYPQNQKHYTVKDIQVSRNTGNHNGDFHLGDTYNYYIEEARIGSKLSQSSKSCQNPEESKKTVVSVGPFGSSTLGGKPFNDGIHSAVKGLAIEYLEGNTIVNVRFEYDDGGISVWSDKHGEVKITLDLLSGLSEVLSGKNKVRREIDKVRRETIRFNYPDEFLTAVHGRYCDNLLGAVCVVNSLTFKTNRNTYGPFGWTSQNEKLINLFPCFSIHMPGSEIVGFHGRSGRSKWLGGIYSIGAYVKPYHQQIEYAPSKALILYPSEPPRIPEFLSQTKLNKDDRPQNHKHYAVSNIQVSRNEGDHNGAFHLGDIFANCYVNQTRVFNPDKVGLDKDLGYALR